MTELFNTKLPEHGMWQDIYASDRPNTKQRPCHISFDDLCGGIVLNILFLGEEGEQSGEPLQNEDDGRIGEEEENDEIGIIESQSELALEDVVVESDTNEQIGICIWRAVLMMEKKAITSARSYFFWVGTELHSVVGRVAHLSTMISSN